MRRNDANSRFNSSKTTSASGAILPAASAITMMRYRKALSRSLSVRPGEWILLTKMSAMLAALLILQRFVPLPRLMALYDAEPAESPRVRVNPQRLVYLVNGVVRVALRDSFCMKRSLLLFHFLRKWGHDARIYFGVVKDSNALKGHAWVDLDGAPMAEWRDPRQRYTITYSYPPADHPS